MRSVLTAPSIVRLEEFARRAWRADRNAALDAVARAAARQVVGLNVVGRSERLRGGDEEMFFAVVAVVAAQRARIASGARRSTAFEELRTL